MGKKEKVKTANRLEERFQWREGLHPDHIFDEEKEMILELRSKVPQLERETDKFAAAFLFARRHDIKETVALLKNFYKKKEEHAPSLGSGIPSFRHTKILQENKDMGGMPLVQPIGYRDHQGRMIRYMRLAGDDPSSRDLKLTYAVSFWLTYFLVATEPVNAFRNGTVIIMDMKNAGMSNFDMSSKGREMNKAMQGVFPTRVRDCYLVNCGSIVGTLLTAAKLVMPRKLTKRIKVVDPADLKNLIPSEYLLPSLGGSSPEFGLPEVQKQVVELEENLFAEGVWMPPFECATVTISAPQS